MNPLLSLIQTYCTGKQYEALFYLFIYIFENVLFEILKFQIRNFQNIISYLTCMMLDVISNALK